MTNRETEEAQKRKEEKAMQEWLASDEYKVYRKEQLEANAKLCETGLSDAEFPPDPEAQKYFAKCVRAKLWGVVDQYNADAYPDVEFTEES
jgi:hypothetical protein